MSKEKYHYSKKQEILEQENQKLEEYKKEIFSITGKGLDWVSKYIFENTDHNKAIKMIDQLNPYFIWGWFENNSYEFLHDEEDSNTWIDTLVKKDFFVKPYLYLLKIDKDFKLLRNIESWYFDKLQTGSVYYFVFNTTEESVEFINYLSVFLSIFFENRVSVINNAEYQLKIKSLLGVSKGFRFILSTYSILNSFLKKQMLSLSYLYEICVMNKNVLVIAMNKNVFKTLKENLDESYSDNVIFSFENSDSDSELKNTFQKFKKWS
jgi:hypothetical protein